MTQTIPNPTTTPVPSDPGTAGTGPQGSTQSAAQPVPTVQGEIVTGPTGGPGTGPRRSPSGTGPAPAPLVVPAKPTAFAAAELTTIVGSTAAYAGGVPGLIAAAGLAGGTAAVAGIRRARTNRQARQRAGRGTGTGGTRRVAGGGRQPGRLRRAASALGSKGRRAAAVVTGKGRRRAAGHGAQGGTGRRHTGAVVAGRRPGRLARALGAEKRSARRAARAAAGTGGRTSRRSGRLFGRGTGSRAGGRRNGGLFGRGKPNRAARGAGTGKGGTAHGTKRGPGLLSKLGGRSGGLNHHRIQRGRQLAAKGIAAATRARKKVRSGRQLTMKGMTAATRARRKFRMVRQTVTGAPSARAARSATYRKLHPPTTTGKRHPVKALPAKVTAGGWSGAAWVLAIGYMAWSQHWAVKERIAQDAAARSRGYVVAERVRPTETPTSAQPVLAGNRVPLALPGRPVRRILAGAVHTITTLTSTNNNGGTAMFTIADLAAEQAARTARYTPESMANFARDLDQWPQAIGHLALALSTFVKKGSAEYPVNPAVMEKLAEVYRALGVATSAASEVPGMFKRVHATDLERHEAPRPGEQLWNVNR